MPSTLFDLQNLQPAIDQQALILTPNSRLNRRIIEAYNQQQMRKGEKTWTPLRSLSLQHWLQECVQTLWTLGYAALSAEIINDQQALWLWTHIIKQDQDLVPLMDPTQTAQIAHQALKLLLLWNIEEEELNAHNAGEHALFIRWREQFLAHLQNRQQMLPEQAIAGIKQAFEDGTLPLLKDIYLQSFDAISPAHSALLRAACTNLHDLETQAHTNCHLQRLEFANLEEELRAAARWSVRVLNDQPDASIGIITPNLGQHRAEAERIFTEVFEFNYLHPDTARYTLPFNFSAGTPLAQAPVIKTALGLLRLEQIRHTVTSIRDALFSPFSLFNELSLDTRSEWLELLEGLRTTTLLSADVRRTLDQISDVLDDQEAAQLNSIQTKLQTIREQKQQRAKLQTVEQWAASFEAQLTLFGWPGNRRLDSVEYQQVNQWFALLDDFRKLGQIASPMNRMAALNHLSNMASATHFQAQTPDSPLQILGILEGAGLRFSHCWVFGMTDKVWPVSPSPNPLLPQSLQKLHAMPHATAERELDYARSLTTNYRHAANDVVFSSSHFADDQELAPSPLIRDIPLNQPLQQQLTATSQPFSYATGQYSLRQLEWFKAGNAPPISEPELPHIKGGTTILQWQSACPFNAFARYRLGAEPLRQATDGIPAIERGVLIHQILANVWEELETSERLHQLTPAALESLLVQFITQAFAGLGSLNRLRLGDELIEIEKQRQQALLMAWLDIEKQRPAFRVIAIEHPVKLTINGLPLRMRIDRIDQLPDGRFVLLDYKTGTPSFSKFIGARPEEPQLPLYGISLWSQTNAALEIFGRNDIVADDIAAIGYANINVKSLGFSGLSNGACGIDGIFPLEKIAKPGLASDWALQWQQWHDTLASLSREFIAGEAQTAISNPQIRRYYDEFMALTRSQEDTQINQLTLSNDFLTRWAAGDAP